MNPSYPNGKLSNLRGPKSCTGRQPSISNCILAKRTQRVQPTSYTASGVKPSGRGTGGNLPSAGRKCFFIARMPSRGRGAKWTGGVNQISFLAANLDGVADRRLRLNVRSHLHFDNSQELKTTWKPL